MNKVWKVYNGWMGNNSVHMIVTAETKIQAKNLASKKYKKDAEYTRIDKDSYWQNLEVEILIEDVTKEDTSEVMD